LPLVQMKPSAIWPAITAASGPEAAIQIGTFCFGLS